MDNKKTLIASIIGVALLVVLVAGATFAYFTTAVTNDNGETLVTGKTDAIGSISLTNPTSNLHITLNALDMTQDNLNTYYATNDATLNYDSEEVQRDIAVATLTGGEATTHYECTTTINVNVSGTMVAGLQSGDAYIQFGGLLTDKVDLKNASTTGYPVTFKLNGTDKLSDKVSAAIAIENRNANQNSIAGKELSVRFTNNDLVCKVVEGQNGGDEESVLLAQAVTNLVGQASGNGNVLNENGIRYQGANPDNYIQFNNETWRIIGVFDGYTKIIRNDPLGGRAEPTIMSWSVVENFWEASNKWSDSLVYAYLRDSYYPNLLEKTSVVEYSKWRVGGLDFNSFPNITAGQLYTGESSGNMTAHIGIMSASDYVYASSDCYSSTSVKYNESCANSNWMFVNNGLNEWTQTVDTSLPMVASLISSSGSLSSGEVSVSRFFRPVVYLNSDVKVTGDGSINNKYTIVS